MHSDVNPQSSKAHTLDNPFTNPVHPSLGAVRLADGRMEWNVWAPACAQVELVHYPQGNAQHMRAVGDGYHTLQSAGLPEGSRYAFRVNGRELPDPASRWQPEGVHRPSAIFTPGSHSWSDGDWRGVPREQLVIYELHVGTFTAEGTFEAMIPRLAELRALGVTALEIMPVSQFPGERNWGYDGVGLYAVQNTYGGPAGFQQFIDAAHAHGLAVILDVVYNHFGPEGNYLSEYGPYFTTAYQTPWGNAVNYDGAECDAVRHFVLENARMWIRDFHLDGLRLDAVHAIYDLGARPLLAELQQSVQEIADRQNRMVHVIAESDQNNPRLLDSQQQHGFGLSAVWADDFHHSVRALLAGDTQGYFRDFGQPEHLAKSLERVFVYDGCYSLHRRRRHGAPVENRDRSQFVVCIHNHDQIGNRALGDRSASYLPEAVQRLACGLLLISPCTPLIFMGEEYGETNPFPFFCSFEDPQLVDAVRKGRRREFADLGFAWGDDFPDPQGVETFQSAKLSWNWPPGSFREKLRFLFQDLLEYRRTRRALADRQHTVARVVRPFASPQKNDAVLVVERGPSAGIICVANLSNIVQPCPDSREATQQLLLSTEQARYGGERTDSAPTTHLLPYEMLLLERQGAEE